VLGRRWGLDTKTDWLTDRQSWHNFDVDWMSSAVSQEIVCRQAGSQLRNGKLVAEARDSSGTKRKGGVHCWKPLPSSTVKTATENTSLCVTVKTATENTSLCVIMICSHKLFKSSVNLITNPNPICSHSIM
jgi:hypothetical protein